MPLGQKQFQELETWLAKCWTQFEDEQHAPEENEPVSLLVMVGARQSVYLCFPMVLMNEKS